MTFIRNEYNSWDGEAPAEPTESRRFQQQARLSAPAQLAVGLDADVAGLQHRLQDLGGHVALIDEQTQLGKLMRIDRELRHRHADEPAVFDEPLIAAADGAEVAEPLLRDGEQHDAVIATDGEARLG